MMGFVWLVKPAYLSISNIKSNFNISADDNHQQHHGLPFGTYIKMIYNKADVTSPQLANISIQYKFG